jgi:hypothetical protein
MSCEDTGHGDSIKFISGIGEDSVSRVFTGLIHHINKLVS